MPISKTAQLLKFFAQQHGRQGIPRKRLVKLAYMADILARQYLGSPISNFQYSKDHYGPNARELPEYTKELSDSGLAVEQDDEWAVGRRYIRLRDLGVPISFEFSPGENEVLGYIVANYAEMELEEFIEQVVKQTDPFIEASVQGESLKMNSVDGAVLSETGFDLEAVLRAERQALDGDFSTLSEFSGAIRNHIATGH